MTFLHSEYNSKINLSVKEMLEISQEISRDFTPCFSSQVPELGEELRLSPRELLDIGREVGRDFAPKLSYNIPESMFLPVDFGRFSNINLSAQEMLVISQEISRDFTPCFSSQMPELDEKLRLSPRELLDIGEEVGRDFAPKTSYNTPELMLLPVDPGHLYAYWNLGENRDIEIARPDKGYKDQLTLRIYSQPDAQKADNQAALWFDVAIDSPKTRQQVSLPRSNDETAYSAVIGRSCADDSFIAFAHSNIIHAPRRRTVWRQDHENSTYCLGKNASGQGISKQA
ncbi:MAG: DUF4912 domain-containing protein [Methylobacter sp.]|nr:MAG: DUF4912 domain-containing protein [Methylobacter sp.]